MSPEQWLPYFGVTLSKLLSVSVPHSSISPMEKLAWSKFNYFMGKNRIITMLRHGKLSEQYLPYGTFQSILAAVITVVNVIAVPHFSAQCFKDTVSTPPLTHCMGFVLSIQPFRPSRTECMRHQGIGEGLFFFQHNEYSPLLMGKL